MWNQFKKRTPLRSRESYPQPDWLHSWRNQPPFTTPSAECGSYEYGDWASQLSSCGASLSLNQVCTKETGKVWKGTSVTLWFFFQVGGCHCLSSHRKGSYWLSGCNFVGLHLQLAFRHWHPRAPPCSPPPQQKTIFHHGSGVSNLLRKFSPNANLKLH
jgi:hypothetical protein